MAESQELVPQQQAEPNANARENPMPPEHRNSGDTLGIVGLSVAVLTWALVPSPVAKLVAVMVGAALLVYLAHKGSFAARWSRSKKLFVSIATASTILVLAGFQLVPQLASSKVLPNVYSTSGASPVSGVSQPQTLSTSQQPPPQPTLKSLFFDDFRETGKYRNPDCKAQGVAIMCQTYEDFKSRSKWVGFYIYSSPDTFKAAMVLPKMVPMWLAESDKVRLIGGTEGSDPISSHDMIFTGQVWVYHEDALTIEQKARIIEVFKKKHMNVSFLGIDYLQRAMEGWSLKQSTKPQ